MLTSGLRFVFLLALTTCGLSAGAQQQEATHAERFADPHARAEQADREATATLARVPDNVDALVARARARLQLGKQQESLADFERAAALDPARVDVRAQLALAHAGAGRFAEVKVAADTALALDPQNPAAHYALGLLLLAATTDLQSAVKHLERASAASPAAPEVRFDLLRAFARQGDRARAAVQLRMLGVLLPPSDARILHGQGLLAALQGRLDAAVAKFREAAQAKPELPAAPIEGALAIARALALKGKSDQAVALFEEATRRFPQSVEAHLELAGALEKAGRADEARAARQRVQDLVRELGVEAAQP
ncbi:MAG: tetratricopeptide repeat protein [Candidatus Acidiferrales bacterium]